MTLDLCESLLMKNWAVPILRKSKEFFHFLEWILWWGFYFSKKVGWLRTPIVTVSYYLGVSRQERRLYNEEGITWLPLFWGIVINIPGLQISDSWLRCTLEFGWWQRKAMTKQ